MMKNFSAIPVIKSVFDLREKSLLVRSEVLKDGMRNCAAKIYTTLKSRKGLILALNLFL